MSRRALASKKKFLDGREIVSSDGVTAPNGNGLLVAHNDWLIDIEGLSNLIQVTGGIVIEHNPKLKSTADVGHNITVGTNVLGESVVIRDNPALQDTGI